jgi:ATP-dependent Lon protease
MEEQTQLSDLDRKINEAFAGLVVRKDLVKLVKGNAIVPSYVLEYLLGQYCATSDPDGILAGVETVKEVLRKHYVHRSEAGLVRSKIREKGRYKVIDKVSVVLNEKRDVYVASFGNLGIKDVIVGSGTVKQHPKLLVYGVWCISDIEYEHSEDTGSSPWLLTSIKPIQMSSFDFEGYLESRRQFSTDEWIDLLLQSIGYNPEQMGRRSKLNQLVRLIPFCERNYNLIELGPKGTGKSHIYSEFSPHGILISGGEVTVAKLFVNNSSGKIGLVGYWDVVAFDEFAGKAKKAPKALVDILKNYLANKTFSRGIDTLGAEASTVYVGNTAHTLPYMLRQTNLFDELPKQYYDSAFLDRLHHYLPGWEVDILRGDLFTDGYGFVVDYLAEILRNLRTLDFSQLYREHFELFDDISTRDKTGIEKTFAGLMKILYPHQEATPEEMEELLQLSIEGRKRVKDQLMRIDSTYTAVRFGYRDSNRMERMVKTLEERTYPQYFEEKDAEGPDREWPVKSTTPAVSVSESLKEKHVQVEENQRGISFDRLLVPYLVGASRIVITDPYIRLFYQLRNVMELLEALASAKSDDTEIAVELKTIQDETRGEEQVQNLEQIQTASQILGIRFSWSFDEERAIHARHIVTDHGWKISLDRGLDVFQRYEMNDSFDVANRLQKYRSCKQFEATFMEYDSQAGITRGV